MLPVLLAAAALGACTPEPAINSARLLSMGTVIGVTVANIPADRFDVLVDEVETLLREYERDYYAWGDGELAELNRALAAGDAFDASPALADLIETTRALAIASGGTFEPAVAPLVEAWGFHNAGVEPSEPPAETIERLLASLNGIETVRVDGTRIVPTAGPTMLDLGGIAKGRAVDRIVELLTDRGAADVLVDAGGDLRALGQPTARRWRIGVQSPRADRILATIELASGEAVFTSGDYERFFDVGGERMHHLLDPTTGYPATHTQAVTVIGPNGTVADAAATALFVAGADRWLTVAAALGITDVLRVDISGRLEMTPTMRDRLQVSAEYASDIIVVRP